MTAMPEPPDYDHNVDLTPPHFLDPDPQDSTSCKFCGDVNGYGVLHLEEAEPAPEPHPYQDQDYVYGRTAKDMFQVLSTRSGLVFVPLGPVGEAQSTPPKGARLVVRGGLPVSDIGGALFAVETVGGGEK